MQKLFMCLLLGWLSLGILYAQPARQRVEVLEIKGEIDAVMKRYVSLGLADAEKNKADIILIDMDTYGGIMTDAIDIVQMILKVKKPVLVFINSNAASAGALISIGCDSIYMSAGASMGAATVVQGNSGTAAPDKYQSYMRSKMRATALATSRDPQIAEGMVDETMVIDSLKPAGRVLTLTTAEAIRLNYCQAQVSSIDDVIKRNGVASYNLSVFQLTITDTIISFFMNPFISGILILIILAGIYFEFQTPGASFPIIAAFVALVLYLVPYYLNGVAEYWEIILLFVGILLLLAEIFVIPGFGVAGIAGITITIASLILIMIENDFFDFGMVPMMNVITAGLAVIGGITGGLLLLFFGGAKLSNSKAFNRIALTTTQQASHGFTVNTFSTDLLGQSGTAWTVLRPSGKVMIDGRVFDAFTRGEYIDKGTEVVVISTEGISLQVRSKG